MIGVCELSVFNWLASSGLVALVSDIRTVNHALDLFLGNSELHLTGCSLGFIRACYAIIGTIRADGPIGAGTGRAVGQYGPDCNVMAAP